MQTSNTNPFILYLIAASYFTSQAIAIDSYTANPGLQVISKAFHATGRTPGTVTFSILPDPDPVRYGVRLLGYPNPDDTVGFPTAHGTVYSPNSLGYSSFYGWIQLIAHSNTTLTADNAHWMIDLLPAVATLNNPFTWYGPEAQLFDGPFNLEQNESDWSARSFLTYMPNPALTHDIVPLLGFEWGYWLTNGTPMVKELKSLDLDVWNEHLGLFRSNFTGWNFTEV